MSEEARRKEILELRAENPRTAARVEQGTAYHELVEVYFTDRAKHTVQVHALSEGELLDACKKAGSTTQDLKDKEKAINNMELVVAVAEISTRDPEIRGKLLANQAAKIALKAFELMKPPKD